MSLSVRSVAFDQHVTAVRDISRSKSSRPVRRLPTFRDFHVEHSISFSDTEKYGRKDKFASERKISQCKTSRTSIRRSGEALSFTAETPDNSAIKRKDKDAENKFGGNNNGKGNAKGNVRKGSRSNFNRNKLMQNDAQQKRKVLINPHFKGNVPIRNNGNVELLLLLYPSFRRVCVGNLVWNRFEILEDYN